jgi:putative endonuclease
MKKTDLFYVYIAQCNDGTFYIGQTNNLLTRFKQHNGNLIGGAHYTSNKRPIVCRYFEIFSTRSLAMKREYELKKLTHKQKEKICDSLSIVNNGKK